MYQRNPDFREPHEYHWQKHDEDDEFFYVIEGRLLIDLEGRLVELAPRQGFVVPKGVIRPQSGRCRRLRGAEDLVAVRGCAALPTAGCRGSCAGSNRGPRGTIRDTGSKVR
jgi:hypothetical protein